MLASDSLQLHATGNRQERIDRQERADQPVEGPWVEAAKHYQRALSLLSSPPHSAFAVGNSRIVTFRLDQPDLSKASDALRRAYVDLQPGDMIVMDVAMLSITPGERKTAREMVSDALFEAGFQNPMIWAGRKLLEAEIGSSIANVMLTPYALGAGPSEIPDIGMPLTVQPFQLIAIARRGALAPPAERHLKLSVVMPVYNEKGTFRDVVDQLLAKAIPGMDIEICIVESNSTDGTRDEVLRYKDHPRVRLLLEDRPSGKGHAVRQGLQIANGDIVLIQDADLEYDLNDYEKLLKPITSKQAAFVLGSRHRVGERAWQLREFTDQRGLAHVMNLGHAFFTWLLNFIFRQKLRDPFTMFKVFRRDCISNLHFECNRFDFDPELVGKLIRNGFQPIEIDVYYKSRSFHQGKKVSFFRDPPTWIRACVKHRYSNLFVWPASG
jgi:hypothetical protein